jgi:hypothetical protein
VEDVVGRAELALLARLLDLPQHVLDQIALGVDVSPVSPSARLARFASSTASA